VSQCVNCTRARDLGVEETLPALPLRCRLSGHARLGLGDRLRANLRCKREQDVIRPLEFLELGLGRVLDLNARRGTSDFVWVLFTRVLTIHCSDERLAALLHTSQTEDIQRFSNIGAMTVRRRR